MSIRFNLQGDHLLVSKPDNCMDSLDTLSELLRITQQMSGNDIYREAVKTERMSMRLVCDSTRSYNLLDDHDTAQAKDALFNAIERGGVSNCRVTMTKEGKDFISCQLVQAEDKPPYWRVVQTGDFTFRELNYFANILKENNIYSFIKNTRH